MKMSLKKIFMMMGLICMLHVPCLAMADGIMLDMARYTDKHFDVTYPRLEADTEAALAINYAIHNEVGNLMMTAAKDAGSNDSHTFITADIKANGDGIFSVVLTRYVFPKGAAHGITLKKGYTFDALTGERLSLEALSQRFNKKYDLSLSTITDKLLDKVEIEHISLLNPLKTLEKMPTEFYLDNRDHLHLLFQQYEIAPYAAGVIDLDLDAY